MQTNDPHEPRKWPYTADGQDSKLQNGSEAETRQIAYMASDPEGWYYFNGRSPWLDRATDKVNDYFLAAYEGVKLAHEKAQNFCWLHRNRLRYRRQEALIRWDRFRNATHFARIPETAFTQRVTLVLDMRVGFGAATAQRITGYRWGTVKELVRTPLSRRPYWRNTKRGFFSEHTDKVSQVWPL